MLKTEFAKPITIAEIEALHENFGMTVEINDGQISSAAFE